MHITSFSRLWILFCFPILVFATTSVLHAQVTLEWAAHYAGTGDIEDYITATATDSGGNVYVTGPSYGSDTLMDICTIAYDSAGTRKWISRWLSQN